MTEQREVTAKIVFYGPGLSGKTTNLKKVYAMLKEEARGKLMALSTQSDRTIFFDYLPINLGAVRGMKLKIQLYTVPGQVFYNSTRRLVLKNVDGVVFVADSGRRALPDNLESLTNLQENLKLYQQSLDTIPWVLQYNKRDLEDALPLHTLREKLNRWDVPEFEAAACKGKGVMESLAGITKLVVKNIAQRPPKDSSETKPPDVLPVDVRTPSLNVPLEPEMTLPRVQGALTDDELAATVSEDTVDKDSQGDESRFDASMTDTPPASRNLPPQELEIEIDLDDENPAPLPPGLSATTIPEATPPAEEAAEEELAEIDLVEDFDTTDDVEEIEPEEEIQIRTFSKPRWRDGTLIIPMEIKVGNSEFIHELAVRLDPVIETPTKSEE